MDKTLSVVMGLVFAMVMFVFVAQMAQAATQPQYMCPICGETFFTYDELYNHFTTSHVSEPIEIIWE